MIIATFEGSNSYYPSTAVTYLYVGPALEPFPDVPTAEEIAADAAQRTINMMPQFPEATACPEMPAYLTIDLVVILLVIVGIVIGIYAIIKKQK